MNQRIAAAKRFTNLRAAGVPRVLSPHLAWFLSGGLVGKFQEFDSRIPMAKVAIIVDCEHFLPDYQEEAQMLIDTFDTAFPTHEAYTRLWSA